MKTLEEIIKELPENIRLPIYEAFQVFKEDVIHKELKEIKGELKEVWKVINELAEAQKRTEERVNELAEAQKKTEERLNELAEALTRLIGEHAKTREQLGGLSHSFGYLLEDRAIKSLPKILEKDYNIKVIGKLKREYLKIGKEYIEVNIYGKVKKDGEEYTLIGEAKSKVSKKVIENFIKKCEKISKKTFKILISYVFTPEIKEYAKEKGIILIPSYELEL